MSNKFIQSKVDGVYQYPSDVLCKVSVDVKLPFTDVNDYNTLEKLTEWEKKHSNSQGLSAIQIGVPIRIAVVKIKGKMIDIINPSLIFTFGKQKSNESCHSLNNDRFLLTRPLLGIVRYYDRYGKKHYMFLGKRYIRLINHEIDHMDGILINEKGKPYEDANPCNTAKN